MDWTPEVSAIHTTGSTLRNQTSLFQLSSTTPYVQPAIGSSPLTFNKSSTQQYSQSSPSTRPAPQRSAKSKAPTHFKYARDAEGNFICDYCGQLHRTKQCKTKSTSLHPTKTKPHTANVSQVQQMLISSINSSSDCDTIRHIETATAAKYAAAPIVSLEVNHSPFSTLIDTGAEITLVNENVLRQFNIQFDKANTYQY
ncbi:hypothetical protein K450DRAFT_264152, partial [Umbelopsis ramanniana AG]